MSANFEEQRTSAIDSKGPSVRIDSIAWAVLLIFIGAAMLAELRWGWFLIGIGVLALGAQFARWQMRLTIESFWVAGGIVFALAGAWELLALPWSLAPILVILLGAAMLAKAVWR